MYIFERKLKQVLKVLEGASVDAVVLEKVKKLFEVSFVDIDTSESFNYFLDDYCAGLDQYKDALVNQAEEAYCNHVNPVKVGDRIKDQYGFHIEVRHIYTSYDYLTGFYADYRGILITKSGQLYKNKAEDAIIYKDIVEINGKSFKPRKDI